MATKQEVLKDIEETIGFVPQWLGRVPENTIEAEWNLIKNLELGETVIPGKYKELIGLGVAAQMQCPYCVFFHVEAARLNGASDQEIEEAVHVAKQTAGWSTYLQGVQTDLDQFKRETKEMCDALAAKSKAA